MLQTSRKRWWAGGRDRTQRARRASQGELSGRAHETAQHTHAERSRQTRSLASARRNAKLAFLQLPVLRHPAAPRVVPRCLGGVWAVSGRCLCGTEQGAGPTAARCCKTRAPPPSRAHAPRYEYGGMIRRFTIWNGSRGGCKAHLLLLIATRLDARGDLGEDAAARGVVRGVRDSATGAVDEALHAEKLQRARGQAHTRTRARGHTVSTVSTVSRISAPRQTHSHTQSTPPCLEHCRCAIELFRFTERTRKKKAEKLEEKKQEVRERSSGRRLGRKQKCPPGPDGAAAARARCRRSSRPTRVLQRLTRGVRGAAHLSPVCASPRRREQSSM